MCVRDNGKTWIKPRDNALYRSMMSTTSSGRVLYTEMEYDIEGLAKEVERQRQFQKWTYGTIQTWVQGRGWVDLGNWYTKNTRNS